jgi:signal transduction histidine kinase
MKIRSYLLLMAGAIMVPIAVFAVIALQILLRSERETALRSLDETAVSAALLVDRELSSAEAALRVLARSPNLASGDMADFYEHARTADRGVGGRTVLYDADGQQIISTRVPAGTRTEPQPESVRQRIGLVIDMQSTVVSDVITGGANGAPVTTINVPVPLDGGRRFVLASAFAPDYFLRLIARRPLPAALTLVILDRSGHFIANTRHPATLGQTANAELVGATQKFEQGHVRMRNSDGVDSYFAFTRSSMSGWPVVVSSPASVVEGAARRAVAMVATGFLVALCIAGAAAFLFGRRLIRSLSGAARAATALGAGVRERTYQGGIVEVDQLHQAIGESGEQLAQSEAARRALLAGEQTARRIAEQENRTKDEFLAMLSHELRNPLSGIVGAAQLLRLKNTTAATTERATQILISQSKHLTHIVDDLLDLARLSRGKVTLHLQRIELSALVQVVLDARGLAGVVSHSLTYRSEEVWVQGDRTRIEQVVTNLIGNALKYTPEGGRIDIAVTATATHACLTVSDTGVGIAPELMPRLFDIFVQGNVTIDRPQGGLGIGLSLVHQLVTLHDGTIEAASEGVGKGSTFKLCLPRALARTDLATREAFVTDAPRHTGTVLIIDDNEEVRTMTAANLSAAGYTVLEAANGIDGIALAGQQPLCAVIVDIGLPGMDGYQVASALRADPLTANLRLVALTGYGLEADRKRAFAAGFDVHFVKPADFPQLVASLVACP